MTGAIVTGSAAIVLDVRSEDAESTTGDATALVRRIEVGPVLGSP